MLVYEVIGDIASRIRPIGHWDTPLRGVRIAVVDVLGDSRSGEAPAIEEVDVSN
jgi:hypothetical protein